MEKCLKLKIGSCRGCGVAAIAETKLHENGTTRDRKIAEEVAQRVQRQYCPAGETMQVDAILPDQPNSIW